MAGCAGVMRVRGPDEEAKDGSGCLCCCSECRRCARRDDEEEDEDEDEDEDEGEGNEDDDDEDVDEEIVFINERAEPSDT